MDKRIRRAEASDAELLWKWRNDSLVRQNSLNSKPIPWANHLTWFGERLNSKDTVIYILEDGDRQIAQIRFEQRKNDEAEVADISVHKTEREKGYGKNILNHTINIACKNLGVKRLFALIKHDNTASAHTFLAAGFTFQNQVFKQGDLCDCFVYSCPNGREQP